MKKILLLNLFTLYFIISVIAQSDEYTKAMNYLTQKGEVYFSFNISDKTEIHNITKIVSIDKLEGLKVYAYANLKQFDLFVASSKYEYHVLTHPGELLTGFKMYNAGEKTSYNYDTYPTYDAYLNLMYSFQSAYPGLCKIVEVGTTVKNRKILAIKISDNINVSENEGQFLYTSSIHGDETTGYILMLRLINYLLSNYGTNNDITNLINNLEIWINPLANPDGTYAGGNNSVFGARRYNANYVDLNRNYPDPQDGQHPDGYQWQPETQAFMTLATQNNFIMGANFHGGTEVVNYPWDTWEQRHPEDAWFQEVSHLYADLAHQNSPAGYMSGFNDGITNGYDWYEIDGGRQDYMNYFHNCREVTIEISNTKLLPENQLNNLWNYNYPSFIAFMNASLDLIGCKNDLIITENLSNITKEYLAGNSIKATNSISNNSDVHYGAITQIVLQTGFKVYAGNHFLADLNGCSESKRKSGTIIPIIAENIKNENLMPVDLKISENELFDVKIYPNPTSGLFTLFVSGIESNRIEYFIYNSIGRCIKTGLLLGNKSQIIDLSKFEAGIFDIKILSNNSITNKKIIKY